MRRKNKDMNRIDGLSLNLERNNIEKIKELFPEAVEEGKIDFDMLRAMLGDEVDDSKEKYQFTWNGKAKSIKLAQTPSSATLRPCKEKSKNWDTTENIYIEGDNLEVLKQLQKTYYGKIKMIYIDPPYNTGNDFVYNDSYSNTLENYKEQTNQISSSNPESSGRFHTDWLNMIYPRLVLAKNLLSDSGVIIASIDNNEIANLQKILDEVFGVDNCMGVISNSNNPKGRSDDKYIATAHEYLLVYAKNLSSVEWYGFEPTEEIIKRYNKFDELGKQYREIDLRKTGENDLREDRPNLFYYFYYSEFTKDFYADRNDYIKDGYIQIKPQREDGKEGNWRWGIETAKNQITDLVPKFMPSRKVWGVMQKDYLEKRALVKPTSSWTFKDVNSERGTEEFVKLGFDKRIFPKPKPLGTITRCLKLSTNDDSIILDFFSGSATTAHAVMKLNAEDGGNRKFIMVQLPELCDEKKEAYKAGYNNICEIGEERIRRAGEQIKAEWEKEHPTDELFDADEEFSTDIGFKVFKLDSTNVNEWDPNMKLDEKELALRLSEVFKEGRSKEDILYEIMLKYGVFDKPVEEINVNGKTMYRVGKRYMIVCLEDSIISEDVRAIGELSPRTVIFKEAGFNNDNDKINAMYNLEKCGVEDVKCI